ncbi:MAG: alpha/beta fold hydrolase [Candidatus Rokubacteria bacterium]|nr:alpha/beta fold hydrolase [Candidatus Rokubacteria bacterium]
MEEALFFNHAGVQLFGMLHLPSGGGQGDHRRLGAGFVFCDAYADEAFRAHREMVVYARRLAREGFAVLRFDYRGCGDSAGDFEDFALPHWLADIRRALDLLEARGVTTLGLLGLRFGATLAATVAAEDQRVNRLIMWAPVVSAPKYIQVLLMSQITHELAKYGRVTSSTRALAERLEKGGNLDLAGNVLSQEVYRGLKTFDPWKAPKRSPEHVLVVGIRGDTTRPVELEALRAKYPKVELVVVQDKLFWFDKIYRNPSALYDATSTWLRSTFEA